MAGVISVTKGLQSDYIIMYYIFHNLGRLLLLSFRFKANMIQLVKFVVFVGQVRSRVVADVYTRRIYLSTVYRPVSQIKHELELCPLQC